MVYQIYPRSFQDSDGDGVGDLRGDRSRGSTTSPTSASTRSGSRRSTRRRSPTAATTSPTSPASTRASGRSPTSATLADAPHARGIALLLDLVPCHTSIEHPWFREHPDRYVWADAPPNNWRAAFGGPAWTRDAATGRWYLHSFFPEQPDLDWRNPDVADAMQDVVRFWLGHGADGFRLDAIDRLAKHPDLLDDPPRTEPFPFPEPPDVAALDRRHSSHWIPGLAAPLRALRSAAGDAFLVGEVYRPTVELGPYLEHLDTAFVFELMFAPWQADALGAVIERGAALGRGRRGCSPTTTSAASGAAIGEGAAAGRGHAPPHAPGHRVRLPGRRDRAPRRPRRATRPRTATAATARGTRCSGAPIPAAGFTTGSAWLPPVDPAARNVAGQTGDPASTLELYRALIRLRRTLAGGIEILAADPAGLLVYRRGETTVALNLGEAEQRVELPGVVEVATAPGVDPGRLGAGQGVVTRGAG